MTAKRQILVVEDNQLNREMLTEILSTQYSVLEAENGQEALDVLKQYKDSIALVLLDIMMPVMDGYAFLDNVKKYPELSLIPVIVMTQSESVQDEVAALTHGATDFVTKPYYPDVVLHRVASLIKLRETAAMVNQFKYDRLTGVYSKEFFYKKVEELLIEEPEEEYCIVCSNIENFKLVNDIFGNQAGDRLLKEVADIAQAMVGDSGFCGRLSADRFLCLQKRKKEEQDRNNFGNIKKFEISPLLKSVVMRWGIYEITDHSVSVEKMCDRALLAADSIKGQYNQYFAVYDDSLRSKLLKERAITAAMETALAEKQFVVYLQPKYSLNGNCMSGAEALVRWIHPEWGLMSPGEFIPLFEKNGFITRLDQYVWEQVCAQLRDWKDKGYQLMPVSVNVSRADFYQVNLVDTLLELTRKYGVAPEYLHLEFTESAYAENLAMMFSTVEELRKHGFIIEMDDFGSGYSSLNTLSQMKLDILKLDMKFIQNEIDKSPEDSILNDVITMAHRLHLSVVAEGVETKTQVNRLREVDCDYVQGYFFAKPMPVAEFEKILKEHHLQPFETIAQYNEVNTRCLLVADEDAGYRNRVRQTFEGRYRVLESSDAQSAIECIKSYGSDAISAVILSMTLPEKGAEVLLKELRQKPEFWKLPVLATIPGGEAAESLPMATETDDFLCKRHPMFDLNRRVQRLVEITSLRRRELTLRDEANRDPLTKLLNRRGIQAAMADIRKEEQPLAVFLFDLDDLKKVNDTYGHNKGDRMIRAFAELLRRKTRAEDILCRYGGDEFLIILKHMDSPQDAVKKGEDICMTFRSYITEEKLPASCSVGIALCGVDDKMSGELLEHADKALYRAKRENKGGCCLWKADADR